VFTGIVKETGILENIVKKGRGSEITVKCKKILKEIKLGDSISVDGVCLTVSSFTKYSFSAYASEETLKRTALNSLKKGCYVNLEPALKPGDFLGGHFVQGHIEGIGRIVSVERKGDEAEVKMKIPEELLKNVIPKGSIAISGVSLTVSRIEGDIITVFLVPQTLKSTNLNNLGKDAPVNIETDIICRTVVSFLEKKDNLSIKKLIEEGY